ncbi:hypothetical protein ACRYCC_33430 [Actinomadura scrupuli]|uniref:hypothetical protein n=1 Tax=Actinomadura scrupuli TaxID=559629 RepID=UPI003D974B80
MRTATAGMILAAEATLGWSVGLRGDAFFAFVALWVIVLLLCELRGARHHRAPLTGRSRQDSTTAERRPEDTAAARVEDWAEERRSELV